MLVIQLLKSHFLCCFLYQHINEQNILNAVSIEKDVDGFHPLNIGRLAMKGRDPLFVPCTPKGCIELLHRSGVEIKGKRAVVIGRSNIVGMPAALLLQVTFCLYLAIHVSTSQFSTLLLFFHPYCNFRFCDLDRGRMRLSLLCIPEPRTLKRSLDKQILS